MKRMLRPVSNFDKWAKEEETAKDLRGRKIKTMSFHRSQDKWQFQGKKKKKNLTVSNAAERLSKDRNIVAFGL